MESGVIRILQDQVSGRRNWMVSDLGVDRWSNPSPPGVDVSVPFLGFLIGERIYPKVGLNDRGPNGRGKGDSKTSRLTQRRTENGRILSRKSPDDIVNPE